MDYWYYETLEIIDWTTTNVDGIDKKTEDSVVTTTCRITEMSNADLKAIQWITEVDINTKKLYTAPTTELYEWRKIRVNGTMYKIIKEYSPKDLIWTIPYTKAIITLLKP